MKKDVVYRCCGTRLYKSFPSSPKINLDERLHADILRRKIIKNRKEAGTVDFVNGVLFAVMASSAPFSSYDGSFFQRRLPKPLSSSREK